MEVVRIIRVRRAASVGWLAGWSRSCEKVEERKEEQAGDVGIT